MNHKGKRQITILWLGLLGSVVGGLNGGRLAEAAPNSPVASYLLIQNTKGRISPPKPAAPSGGFWSHRQHKLKGTANSLSLNGAASTRQSAAVGVRSGPLVPAASSPIEAINFDQESTTSGAYHIPPDPIGAAGPSHLVNVVNTTIEWYSKAGASQNRQRLGAMGTNTTGSFFASLSPTDGVFDPKVIYDQQAGRFVVVTMEQQDTAFGASSNLSRILVAVSKTSDPNAGWWFTAINSKLNINGSDTWADYPGLAVDGQAIYITANMFTFGSAGANVGTRLWIVNKTPFYSGGTATINVYDPFAGAGVSGFGTLQPALVLGANSVGGAAGTFLVSAGWTSGANDELSIIRVDNPVTSPTFTNQFIDCGDIDNSGGSLPDAPQQGTTIKIATNDNRALQSVWRNNLLYTVNTVSPPSGPDAGQATAHWYQVNASNLNSLTLADQGNIGGEDIAAGTYTFFPSIAVDSANDIGVGFAASGPNIYPGAYYAGRRPSDPLGSVESSVVVAAGQDYYVRTFGGTENRWGDYSGTAIDPSDNLTFWIYNQYAILRGTALGGEDGRWGTRWGSVKFSTATAVQLMSFTATRYTGGVWLNWQTGYEVDNLGFNVYREIKGKKVRLNHDLIAGSALQMGINGTGGYAYAWPDSLSNTQGVKYWLEDIDTNGKSTWHGPAIARPGRGAGSTQHASAVLGQDGAVVGH